MGRLTALLVSLLATVAFGTTGAVATTSLAIVPGTAQSTIGAQVEVDIAVADLEPSPGLSGYDVTLRFDPSLLQLDSMSDTGFITEQDNIVICTPAAIDNAAGTGRATCTPIPLLGSPGVSAVSPVPLVHAVFSGIAAGSSPLDLADSTLSTAAGDAIPVTWTNGVVTIQGTEATATATEAATTTITPVATPTPGSSSTEATATPARATETPVTEVIHAPRTGDGDGAAATRGRRWLLIGLSIGIAAVAFGFVVRRASRPN